MQINFPVQLNIHDFFRAVKAVATRMHHDLIRGIPFEFEKLIESLQAEFDFDFKQGFDSVSISGGDFWAIVNSARGHLTIVTNTDELRQEYADELDLLFKGQPMTGPQFDVLAILLRSPKNSHSTKAARLVLVNCASQHEAAKICGSTNQNVFDCVKRFQDAYARVNAVF